MDFNYKIPSTFSPQNCPLKSIKSDSYFLSWPQIVHPVRKAQFTGELLRMLQTRTATKVPEDPNLYLIYSLQVLSVELAKQFQLN